MADKVTLRRLMRLFAISAKLDLNWLLRDRKFALATIAADLVSNLSVVSGVYLIAARFGGIGGMSREEVLFMMAYSTLVTGMFILFGSGNNIHISRIIGRGQLEHLFVQPLPLGTQLLTSCFAPFTGSGNFMVGLVMLIIAASQPGLQLTPLWLLKLPMYLLTTMVIIVARAYFVSSLAFRSPVAAEEISSTAIEGTWFLSTFPLSSMPVFIQVPLLTVVPEGMMAWFPSMCLLGRPPLGLGAYYPMLYALLLSLIASFVFRKGLNYYVKKGSDRYVPYGFRR